VISENANEEFMIFVVYFSPVSHYCIAEEDGSILYLVDFQQKALEMISDERRERLKAEELERNRREEEEEKRMLSETIAAPQNSDEEW